MQNKTSQRSGSTLGSRDLMEGLQQTAHASYDLFLDFEGGLVTVSSLQDVRDLLGARQALLPRQEAPAQFEWSGSLSILTDFIVQCQRHGSSLVMVVLSDHESCVAATVRVANIVSHEALVDKARRQTDHTKQWRPLSSLHHRLRTVGHVTVGLRSDGSRVVLALVGRSHIVQCYPRCEVMSKK